MATDDRYRVLWDVCQKFVTDNAISCPEVVYQTDRVSMASLEFIGEICDIVGYWEEPDDSD